MNKKQKLGLSLIAGGLVLVLCALFLHYTQLRQDQIAGENAQILLQQLELSKMSVPLPPEQSTQQDVQPQQTPSRDLPTLPMPEKEFMGYSMIGTLRVPSVGICLPILSSWSYPLLNVAPCRYSGSLSEGNLILMGHNYASHFTPLHGVQPGAEVEFEDVNGRISRFTVAQIDQLHKSQAQLLASEYPLTLFTCTPGGQNRIVIRCAERK